MINRDGYEVFKNTYVNDKQQYLEGIFNSLAQINGITTELYIKPVEPINFEFSESIISQFAPKEWILEKIGIDPTKYETVTTVKSVQYALECYKRSNVNCVDQFQVLDFNFDKAVVFNAEQVSGYLNLNIFPKNNITLSLQYPKPNPFILVEPNVQPLPGFEILFSKEENKYRFNQFWDITKDRGEFPIGSGYPPQGTLIPGTTELFGNYPQQFLWDTQPNGYIKTLNPNNMDINKPFLQRKKFRHYLNFLHLRRDVSSNINMILKLTSTKNQLSPR